MGTPVGRLERKNIAEQVFFLTWLHIHKLAPVKILAVLQRVLTHYLTFYIMYSAAITKSLIIKPQLIAHLINRLALNGDPGTADVDDHAGVSHCFLIDKRDQGWFHYILPEIAAGLLFFRIRRRVICRYVSMDSEIDPSIRRNSLLFSFLVAWSLMGVSE